ERIPKILKRFRQSVLAAAVSGKLTEEWRADKPFNPEQKIFSEIIESAQVGLVRSSKEQESFQSESHHSPYLKMNNIDNDWGVSIDELVYVRSDDVERDKYRLKVGDWLFNTRNSSELVGKSCVWKDSCECLYNNNILRIRLLCGYLPDYLEVWFRSPVGRASLESIKSATTSVAAIYQKQLLKQNVPFPDQKEQTEIVRRVDQLFAYADTIETQVNNALERVNNLTQSILAKAFRGELTEQWRKDNPDLISGENSASALLEKIKAERAAAKPVKRGRKKVK
ncbi:MAG: restriction endonuclease subunit S, partial [Pseudomonadales bacterium]|nr:restriction endonuclease subunit S [Pseudomonadales bacterium]